MKYNLIKNLVQDEVYTFVDSLDKQHEMIFRGVDWENDELIFWTNDDQKNLVIWWIDELQAVL